MTNEHLVGQQFIKVYRGMNGHAIMGLDSPSIQGLGAHWTTDRDVAKKFSLGANQAFPSNVGHVLEAEVSGEHVETDADRLHRLRVYDEGHHDDESEVTLKAGAKVNLQRVHQTSIHPETGEVTDEEKDWYRLPKEMDV